MAKATPSMTARAGELGMVEAQSKMRRWWTRVRRARSSKVRDEDQALCAGRNFGGEAGKMIIRVGAALQAQHIAQPAQREAT
jgi:hypothetical protein